MLTILPNKVLDTKKTVRVFRNLNTKKGTVKYSIWQRGKVVAHADKVGLSSVNFVVNHGARLYGLKMGRKQVHAFVEGFLQTTEPYGRIYATLTPASYSPIKGFFFLRSNADEKLASTRIAMLNENGLSVF